LRRGGRGGGFGAGDLVGAAAGVVGSGSGDDEDLEARVPLGSWQEEVRGCDLHDIEAKKSNVARHAVQSESEERNVRFVDLWRWNGRVGQKTYAVVGFTAFLLKRVVDGWISRRYFPDSAPILFHYWEPLGVPVRISKLSAHQAEYLSVMLLAALPFIWLGLAMTTQRLRDGGWRTWLAATFFMPVVNVLFFAGLCFLPSAERAAVEEGAPWPGPRALDRVIPRSKAGSALVATMVTFGIGIAFLYLGNVVLQTYGWGLFVALPFCMGMFSVLLYSYHGPRGFGESMSVALLPLAILSAGLLIVAIEGVICILMVAPLAVGLAALGGFLGYTIQSVHWMSRHVPSVLSVILFVLPGAFGVEGAVRLEIPRYVVHSAIEIDATPEEVWHQVVAFNEIPAPKELLFRAGIAYPIRAEISGTGPGAVRRCLFSTGAFVEPVEIWDEPRLLRFGVTANPAPLNELTPYGHIEPRHLHGYFVSEHGQFLLTPLANGGTRLEGTTWYRNAIWPGQYWRLWSDYIIHRIHMRVLQHIRAEAERSGPDGTN
jgi:uncharacterized membrane protein YhaH (DUF805 family)